MGGSERSNFASYACAFAALNVKVVENGIWTYTGPGCRPYDAPSNARGRLPYLALAAAFLLGYWGISRGLIIEPPAVITDTIAILTARLAGRGAQLTGQTP